MGLPQTGADLYAIYQRHLREQANRLIPDWDDSALDSDTKAAWGRLAEELREEAEA